MGQKLFREDLFAVKDGKPVVVGNRCRKCGAISFPKNDLCVFCLGEDLEEVEIARTGELYSYTITRRQVDNWKAPHAIGMVRIPEQQVTLVAPLAMEGEEDNFVVDEKVEMVIDKYWDEGDDEIIGYKFRKVSNNEGGGCDA